MEAKRAYGPFGRIIHRPQSQRRSRTNRWYMLVCGLVMALSTVSSEALSAPRWWDKHEWTQEDTALQVAYTVLHIADWGQTLDIENHPGHFEHNPILGRHPSRGRVNTYFATTLGLHWLIARALPRKWRNTFQAGTITLQFVVVKDNYEGGIRINF